jgi:hypothetical protein
MQDTGREIFRRIQNLVCFGKIARRNVDGFDLLREFKPQQIHILGNTAPVFDGVASKIPASFEVGADWVEAVIHFDQTERLYALHFDVESALGQSVEIEIYRYQEFMKFTTLFDSKIIKKPGQYSYPLNEGEVFMAMGLKLRMRSNTADIIKIRAVPEVHTNYLAQQMQQFDASGYLKAASDGSLIRQDPLFDTKNIEGGLILETLPAIIKPEEAKVDNLLFPRLEERKTNLIGEPLNQGISLYVHLMNRNENVQANLPNWLTQKFDEIILLDWSSKEPVASIPNLFVYLVREYYIVCFESEL